MDTRDTAPVDPPPLDRRSEIGLGLRQLFLNLGLAEARFGQTLTLDEIADGIDVTRDDVCNTILSAYPDTDPELLRATESVGDVMDLIVGLEEDATTERQAHEAADAEEAARRQAEVLNTGTDDGTAGAGSATTDAGPITGGPTTGPADLPPATPGDTATLEPLVPLTPPSGSGPAIPLPTTGAVSNTGAAQQASDDAATGSER